MTTVNERIRTLRKTLKLSQTEFGRKLGVKIGVIRNFEYNKTTPTSEQMHLIAKIFDVNIDWLQTGEGGMINAKSQDAKIASWMGSSFHDEFQHRFIYALSQLKPEHWEAVKFFMKSFSEYEPDDSHIELLKE